MVSFRALIVQSLQFNAFGRFRLFSGKRQSGRIDAINWTGIRTRCFSFAVEASEFECEECHDDLKATEKETALRLAVSRLSGSLKLDLALGIGGLPKGRMVEIYGREASGKTTLALHIIKEAQKLGGYCAYLDVENAMDPFLAESMGVDTENLLISQPDSAENLLSVVDTLTKSGSIDVIVVDSVAALVPQCELDFQISGTYKDIQSQIMNQALRKIHYSLCRSRTLIIFVNQVRSNLKSGQGFGPTDEVTCGGNALQFYAAIRMRIIRTGLLKVEDEVTGLGICVQVVKNKLAPAMKKAELGIHFGRGICCESEVLDLACEHGVILREGSSYFIEGEVLKNRLEAERYLTDTDGVLDKIVKTLRSQLFETERRNHGGS
ncbi:hypothetical protein F0562_015578 [Nyssa sinensis]|uniref:RecA family profile 2 domain-containing protein n=1 Tax=Nyssa sinensis TaxID=561372 RepID=A0A5J4ZJX2_9ASTE|nr:hypothetical protein F0562_015578 [Nyssa sinensis]